MPAQWFINHAPENMVMFEGSGLADGTSLVCLDVEEPEAVLPSDGAWHVAGLALSDTANSTAMAGNLVACTETPMRILEVRDDGGMIWTLGYSWTTEDGWDRTPATGVQPGDQVEMIVRDDPDSNSAGFVLSENDQLLYAMESGRGGQGLDESDLDLMTVTEGDYVTTVTGPCGEERSYVSLDFTADGDRERLGPDGDAVLNVDGEFFTVCNITSYTVTEPAETCGEDGEMSWMVFR